MADKVKPGDKVSWNSSGGASHGMVERKVTSETKVGGHVAKATKEEPQFVVKSDRSGKKAVHKPDELKKG